MNITFDPSNVADVILIKRLLNVNVAMEAPPVAPPTTAKPSAGKPTAAKPSAAKPAAPADGEKTYEKYVRPFALALAKKDQPALLEIYKQLGVSVGTELKPEQWDEARQLVDAKLAEIDAASKV